MHADLRAGNATQPNERKTLLIGAYRRERYIYIYIDISVCMYVCIYVYMYTYMYICLHSYTIYTDYVNIR